MSCYLKNEADIRSFISPRDLSVSDWQVLSRFPCFKVVPADTYVWSHNTHSPSLDILFVVNEKRWRHKCQGCIIADPQHTVSTDLQEKKNNTDIQYPHSLLRTLSETIAYCKALPPSKQWHTCLALPSLQLPPALYMAIFRASIDSFDADTIIHKACLAQSKRPGILPAVSTLVRTFQGANPNQFLPCKTPEPNHTAVDVCLVLRILPRLIATRQVPVHQGYAIMPDGIWSAQVYQLYKHYAWQVLRDGRLHTWLEKMSCLPAIDDTHSNYPEWKLAQQIRASLARKQQQRQLTILNSTTPPLCIQQVLANPDWKNQRRYELAYVLLSISRAWSIPVHLLARPYLEYMHTQNMDKSRIAHVATILKGTYRDKRRCVSRTSSEMGIECPYGGGIQGVDACLTTRVITSATAKVPRDTFTISAIWSTTEAIITPATTRTSPRPSTC
jgi:hypothetical protein